MSALRLNDNFLEHCPGVRAVAAGQGGWRRLFFAGTAAVLAGLTFLGGIAVLMRYETVMPEDGAMRMGELCVVLDRWTGETKPCTAEAIARRRSQRPDPQPAESPGQGEALWQRIVEFVAEFIEVRWLPMMRPSLSANR
ncbi:MAG: hypothetical protein LC123_03285 [Burkholderiales bacterium]|nr:hypothetical protein [Rhodocyclaceae bacterium]MCZ2112945.1 hypothetical protein [Anaerolineae bacterium]MCZ2418853.1 hypothetical protein [Burkholderiales bacterium]